MPARGVFIALNPAPATGFEERLQQLFLFLGGQAVEADHAGLQKRGAKPGHRLEGRRLVDVESAGSGSGRALEPEGWPGAEPFTRFG